MTGEDLFYLVFVLTVSGFAVLPILLAVIIEIWIAIKNFMTRPKRKREALSARADEQHWWVVNGALIGDPECMAVGVYGDWPPA